MDRFMPGEFDLVIRSAQDQKCSIADVEVSMLGFDHTDVGALLADKWGIQGHDARRNQIPPLDDRRS